MVLKSMYGTPMNIFKEKTANFIKNNDGALTTDIMRLFGIKINNSSWAKFERQLDLMTNLYKDETTNLWHICPWAI